MELRFSHYEFWSESYFSMVCTFLYQKGFSKAVSQGFNKVVSKAVPQDQKQLQQIAQGPVYQVLLLASPKDTQKVEQAFPELNLRVPAPLRRTLSIQTTQNWKGFGS